MESRVRRSLVLAFVVLAVAAVAAGCGGGDDETTATTEVSATAEWADGLCSAASTWKGELVGIASQFTDPSSLTEDGLRSAADDAKEATDTFRDDLDGLGTPIRSLARTSGRRSTGSQRPSRPRSTPSRRLSATFRVSPMWRLQ